MVGVSDDAPQSIEEAGALLGAAITRYSSPGAYATINPPKGTHSSFSTINPVPSSELMILLHSLRSLLRSAPTDTPLVAAPSLLAGVLLKLLSISSTLASAPVVDPSRRVGTPPMLSTPLRKLWVDCVVLCHTLGEGLSGNARINIYGFIRNMIALAAMNPRTARAAGGTRIAALEVIGGLMEDEKLSKQLASWSLDVIELCKRALRSSGNGEPTYRIAAVRTACSVSVASRFAFMATRPMVGSSRLLLKGALEDKAILEIVKLLKVAIADTAPEVRHGAASLVSLLAPLVIHISIKSPATPDAVAVSPTASLEEIMTMAFRNLDDESPFVAAAWAEALARCMSTSIEYHKQKTDEKVSQRNVEGGAPNPSSPVSDTKGRSQGRKGILSVSICPTLPKALRYLVGTFISAGGELTAPRAGGSFSTGGRAVRLGLAKAMIELLRVQTTLQAIGEGRSISHKDAILIALSMVGGEMENQLSANDRSSPPVANLDATSVVTASTIRRTQSGGGSKVFGQGAFGQGPKVSHADAGIARLASSRVLREGISIISSESTQISILHELIQLCVSKMESMKGNQLQVIMVEISHLLSTLGEAAESALDDLMPVFEKALRHPDHGVRHETAVACAAMTSVFPVHGCKLVQGSINSIQLEHAELMTLASTMKVEDVADSTVQSRFRFRRAAPVKEAKVDESLKHQYAIHGMALAISMIIRDLPNLPGGLPMEILDRIMSVSEILTSSFFSDQMTTGNPSAACTSVRAGFALMSGVLAAGPAAITKHIALIFGVWQKVSKTGQRGKQFTPDHELICIEAMLVSIVSFLKHCSELLLSIPDALSRTSLILEEMLPLFFSNARFGIPPQNPVASSRLDSAKATILEAFAWLPPGSYPMIADTVFNFAAGEIQLSIENDVACSLINSLVSKEDALLDSVSLARAKSPGQVGGAKDLESDIAALISEAAHHGDRESAIYFFESGPAIGPTNNREFLRSKILGITAQDDEEKKPPTVLHEVGTWRRPAPASCCAKVRLVDAAVQAFAGTFTLKSGREQQAALEILESLLPPVQFHGSRTIGVAAGLSDQDRRGRSKSGIAGLANVTAVLLSCLRALPINDATHNIPIGLGPSWMNKAKDVLLSVLPSPSKVIQRGAAEGLALLATLGVKEDAHFLQSAVLHALDEIMHGNDSQLQGRSNSVEYLSTARSGALLALACIQRTSDRIIKIRSARSRMRGSTESKKDEGLEDMVQMSQIMIRVLPSIAFHLSGGFFGARTYGLHAFGLLMSYKFKIEGKKLDEQDSHLFRKTVELVEDNFLSAWTAASSNFDQGNEAEKICMEAPFLAVLLRLMTFLLPSLHLLDSTDSGIAGRFSKMASIIMECSGSHPIVHTEGMAFWEVLSKHRHLLPAHTGGVKYDEHPLLCCIPSLMANLAPRTFPIHPQGMLKRSNGCEVSVYCIRSSLILIQALSLAQVLVAEWTDMKAVALLLAALESTTSSRNFSGDIFHRGIAAPREIETAYTGGDPTESEISNILRLLPFLERKSPRKCLSILLRYILLSRSLVVGNASSGNDDDNNIQEYTIAAVVSSALERAASDVFPVLELTNSVRWQVKTIAIQLATIALAETVEKHKEVGGGALPMFDLKAIRSKCLEQCRQASATKSSLPESEIALHADAIVTAACVTSTATVDQAELRILQESAVYMLIEVVKCFEKVADPDQKDATLLNEYIPQISSCIKNALGAAEENSDARTCRLFIAGCRALEAFVRTKVTQESNVLKRIIRPVLPSANEFTFFGFNSATGSPEGGKDGTGTRSSLTIKIGRLWTMGSLWSGNTTLIESMLEAGKIELGVNAAAIAIDGARLLVGSGLSLIGTRSDKPPSVDDFTGSGFFFGRICDVDMSVKSALVNSWAACASLGVSCLCDSISRKETSPDKRDAAILWLKHLVPLLFAGLRASTGAPNGTTDTPEWSAGIDQDEVACRCMQGISSLVSSDGMLEIEEKWQGEVLKTAGFLSEVVLAPVLAGASSETIIAKKEITTMACSFLTALAQNATISRDEESTLLLSFLRPLNQLQSGGSILSEGGPAMVVSSCLTGVAAIITKPGTKKALVEAMLALILYLSSMNGVPDSVRSGVRALTKSCVGHDATTVREKSALAAALAKAGDWDAWSIVARLDNGAAVGQSLTIMQSVLLDSNTPEKQLAVISHLSIFLQSVAPPSSLVGRIVYSVGAEVLSVFQAYGTLNVLKSVQTERPKVCAECMKISLVAYQQFASDADEEELAIFLVMLFQTFIAILRFNGLPNHPPPQPTSDPAIGRMCAQAILHIARTTAAPFKVSMTKMAEHDRAVLEFAVRAEMSGYATAAAAPAKKKLNLKSFKT